MSNLTVKGNASGTGTVILEAPNTNSNRTITLPDAATTLVGTDATQTLTNKTIDASQLSGNVAAARITNALNASGSAPIYACRAWVYFNGNTAGTPILASGNVTSVTDHGVGDFTVNLTTAMADTNYVVVASASMTNASVSAGLNDARTKTTSAAPIVTITGAGNNADRLTSVAIFR